MADRAPVDWRVELGDAIPETSLRRRFEARGMFERHEIAPAYVGPAVLHGAALDDALPAALRAGYRGVVVHDRQYIHAYGEWYAWSPGHWETRGALTS